MGYDEGSTWGALSANPLVIPGTIQANGGMWLPDDVTIGFGNTISSPYATTEWVSATGMLTSTIGSSSVERNGTTETHTVTNFIFKPIANGVTWSNYAYQAAANLNFFRAQGSDGAEESIVNGAILHSSFVQGYHEDGGGPGGGDYYVGAKQSYTVDGAVGAGAEIPTRWELSLTPDGGTTPELALAVGSDKLAEFKGDVYVANRIIRSKSVYAGTDTTDDVSLHVCDSATAFTLTVTDGTQDGEEIKIINRGAGTVTLSGKLSSITAVSTLSSGESMVLNWDVTDDEWQ